MTPAGVLDRVLPRWRAALASRYSPGDLDGFIERNRAVLESLVGQAMTRQRPSARVPTPWSPRACARWGSSAGSKRREAREKWP